MGTVDAGHIIQPSDYYRVGFENRLPAREDARRQNLSERLQLQFEYWQKKEQNGALSPVWTQLPAIT